MIQEILSLAKILITIPTITGDEQALNSAVEIVYQDLYAFNVKRYYSNGISSLLYYNTEKLPDTFTILLNTNLDVVPGKESQFTPYEKDGKLYGRGAWDMKTATVAMILAYKAVAHKVSYPLGLQLVSDQETGGKNGTKHQLDQGIRTEFAIVSSTTNLDIIHESKGQIWLKISAPGKSAATGTIWQGENALWKMKQFLHALEQLYPEPKEEAWKTSVNLASISTPNSTFNIVPDTCEALLEIRPVPEEKDTIMETIQKILPSDFSMDIVLHEPTQFTPKDHPHIGLLQHIVKKTTNQDHKIIKSHYVDEVRYFNAIGIPGISFGPIGANSHSDNEWVDLHSVLDYYHILTDFLLSIKP